jgi:predicted nucleotidyltransferase
MLKHHEDSIKNMIEHYKNDLEISALFLIGSVATETARPDSDLDGVAVVSQEYFNRRKESNTTMEGYWGKCTYENGYFDIHYKTREHIESILNSGSEPMRNMFSCATPLYCDDVQLIEMVSRIPVLPEAELAAKKQRYYCTMKQYHNLTDEEAATLVNDYEAWTTYNFPKDFQFIANNFADPYEWQ